MKLSLLLSLVLSLSTMAAIGAQLPQSKPEAGIASWYGPGFEGKATANGDAFDSSLMTAAHKTLKFGSMVRVTNLDNGKVLVLRVNDRGPFKVGRIIDVSKAAAVLLGFKAKGIANVTVEVVAQK